MKNSSGRKKESGGTFGKKSYSKSDSGEKRSYSSAGSKRSDEGSSEGGEKKRRFNKPAARLESEGKTFIEKKVEGSAKRYYSKKTEGDDSSERKSYSKDSSEKSYGDREKRSYSKDGDDKKPYGDREKRSYSSDSSERKPYGDREKKSYSKDSSERKPYGDREKRSYSKDGDDKKPYGDREKRSYSKDSSERKPFGDREKKPFSRDGEQRKTYGERERKPFAKDGDDKKPFGDREKRSYSKDSSERKPYGDREKKPYSKDSSERKPYGDREKRPYSKEGDERKSFGEKRSFSKPFSDEKKTYKRDSRSFDNDSFSDKPKTSERWSDTSFERSRSSEDDGYIKDVTSENKKPYKGSFYDNQDKDKKTFTRKDSSSEERDSNSDDRKKKSYEQFDSYERKGAEKPKRQRIEKTSFASQSQNEDGLIRLNKFIANSGVCSRREADKLIESGAVSVNGKVVAELGYKVKPEDEVHYGGTPIKREKHVYILLNKPKDYITTLDDPEGRKTVMELIKNACKERVYPVGRLDRNTTGLLLFTNDGEMTMKLTHPKNNIQKLYSVELDKSIKPEDFKAIMDGIELEDGMIKPDKLEFVGESTNRREIGIEIHSGRNRIVRRMFEHLGYKVVRLDRVMFAGLTKKDLPRSRWRLLTERELSFLRMVK